MPINKSTSSKKFILVVEDDRFYGKIYKTKLDKEGYEVELTIDGKQALTTIQKKKPDLILLDLIMPGMDGFQFLEAVNGKDKKYGKLKILVLSNLGQEDDIKRAMELGATDYLVKASMSLAEVIAKIGAMVNP